jgi:hypothetical protein
MLFISACLAWMVKNYGPKLTAALAKKDTALNAISQIKSLIQSCEQASEDGTITPEEAQKIMTLTRDLVSSTDIKELLEEFSKV